MRSRLYRLLLRLFPRDMRDEFGAEMEELFVRHRRGARGLSVFGLWIAAAADAARHGIGARLDRSRCRSQQEARVLMDLLNHDVRYALRMLLKQRSVTAMMLATLALGIGANTAVFSVVNAVLLRPLPYPEPDALAMVYEKRAAEGVMDNSVSPADFLDWRAMNQSFASLASFSETTADLTGTGDPVQVTLGAVSADFFNVLGIRALHGRTFAPDEDVLGQHRVVVLGHPLWQQRFGGDASIVGRQITLNGIPQQVIGVLPPGFEAPKGEIELWAPLALRGTTEPPTRTSHFLRVFGRLKSGVALEAARSELDTIGRRLEEQYPNLSRGHGAHVVALRDDIVSPVRRGLIVLSLAVGFVLLIACTNVANLLLARAAGRRRELAIRSAIGAARNRLLRQSLTESVVLAMMSGILGLGVAWLLLDLLVTQTPPMLRGVGLERAGLDLPVLAFSLLLCVVTGVLAGLVPAWLQSREDLNEPLREGGRSPAGLRRSVRFVLVVAEVSLTSILLVGAGLMLRSLERVLSQPAGFETDSRLVVPLTLPRSRYGNLDAVRRARQEFETRLAGTPGVIATGANNNLPFTASDARQGITVEGLERRPGDTPVRAHLRIVTTRYFETMGIRLRQGRALAESDGATSPLVVVVNETMARRYWPDQSPIGKRMRFNDPDAQWREVVGVIQDVRHWGLDREVNPELYMPHEQQPSGSLTFVLHTSVAPASIAQEAARRVHEVDPNLAIGTMRTMEEVAARAVAARRWSAVLLASFGALALVLAAVGIYGVMAQLVSTRTSEIGIRLTLGARPSTVLAGVISEGVLHALAGLAVGLGLSLGLMRGLQSLLFDVAPTDPLTLVAVALTLLGVSLAACVGPATRAMRIDPVVALREE
jgi:putative ABC transport system permease protein